MFVLKTFICHEKLTYIRQSCPSHLAAISAIFGFHRFWYTGIIAVCRLSICGIWLLTALNASNFSCFLIWYLLVWIYLFIYYSPRLSVLSLFPCFLSFIKFPYVGCICLKCFLVLFWWGYLVSFHLRWRCCIFASLTLAKW